MKKAKKLLVTLLVFAFVLSTFTVGFAATSSSAKVTDENLPKEVVRAMALGYLKGDDQGNLNLDKPITRAEALAIVVRISGLETSASLMKGQTKFADANADPSLQWATGYINLGVGQGIINGYPDGTFRGNANVTYAEMAKMLLYAMNYGVTVEGAPWPAGVMGKADDLGLFDDVSASPDAPAIRGDVVMMVDNSLTVAHLKQTGYGDLKQYEEDENTTFLSKMKVDEYDDVRVTAIARTDSALDEDEVELTEYDSKGNETNSDVYTLLTDETPEALFGLKVDAWINDDDEIVFVDISTNAKDILLDTVTGTPAKDEIELKVADDTFDVASGAEAYVNFSKVTDFSKIPADAYGKFVRESGKLVFANVFSFKETGVVTEVDKTLVKFVDAASGDDDEIDLSDYDDVYIYNPDFSKADVKDIKEYSSIFYWEDDDEINIVVNNNSVEGKVDAVKADSIKIDGTWYDKGNDAVVTLDKGDNYDVWEGLDNVEDFVDEDVTAVLDLNGEVMLVTGAAKATSGNLYGVVTYAKDGRYVTLTVFNKEGKEVDYTAESSTEFHELTGFDYYKTGSDLTYAALKYKLTSANEIAKEKSVVAQLKGDASVVKAYPADKLTTSVLNSDVYVGKLVKDPDKKLITVGGSQNFYVTSDTVIMQALNSDGELDPAVITTDKFISLDIKSSNEAVVFKGTGNDADFIVMLNKEFSGVEEDIYYGVVTDDPYKSGGSYYATINVFGEGEKDYKIDDVDKFEKGSVVAFKFNNKDEAVVKTDSTTADIVSYKDGYLTTSKGTFKVDSGAVLYSLDDKGKLDKKITRAKLGDYKDGSINYVLDEDDGILIAATVSEKPAGNPPPTTGTVSYIADGLFNVTLPSDAKTTDTFVVMTKVGATVKSATVVNGKADFGDSAFTAGDIGTAELYNLKDLNTALASTNFIAKATPKYAVTFSVTGSNGSIAAKVDGVAVTSVAQVKEGKDVVFTATPDAGYRVKEWTVNGTAVAGEKGNTFTLTNVKEAKTVTVAFEAIPEYTITFANPTSGKLKASVDGTEISTGALVAEGKDVVFLAIPDAGYRVKEWTVNGTAVAGQTGTKFTLSNVKANATVAVVLEALPTKTVTFTNPANGTLTAKVDGTTITTGATVLVGKDIVFTVTPDAGYRVKEWTVNGTAVAGATGTTFTLTNLTENVTVAVVLELDI
ncbi:S-layer homology domain-containing protein [Tepidanaerobacter sp. EBM-49]|uniref:InlB B-repeat-containing protein n=1 Tax=Tepidanaerobacter sp. EBM-49 TaxID=1918504 RepID=UPI000AF6C765|nr:S-layer homology domain-containing protein [Tepidanaerobacter sp. EBM-49]